MLDLRVLLSGRFDPDPGAPTRVALAHHSFRAVSIRRGVSRQRFAAHFPALGLLNLVQSLRDDAGAGVLALPDIRYFDQESYPDQYAMADDIKVWLEPSPRPVVALSAYTSTVDRLEDFCAQFDPTRFLLVVGGSHATLAPNIENVHLVVRGEGGAALRHILSNVGLPSFGSSPDAEGICYLLDNVPVLRKAKYDRSIEQVSSPCFAYDLLPPLDAGIYDTNFTRMLGASPQVYICTQSCQARCTFCSTYLIHGRQVARPAAKVAEDLRYLVVERGHDALEFHDDDFMQHPELDAVLEAVGCLGVPWFCYARVERIDDVMAKRLAAAGCRRVFLGVESMRQKALDYFNKATTAAQNATAVESLAAEGIGVVAGFIIGGPDDTVDDVLFDLDALLELSLFAINCSILSPDPGTIEFRRAWQRPELAGALGGANRLRVIPDTDVYGILSPVGLPTVCREVGKRDLNLFQAMIDAAFYGRSHIWAGLTEGRSPEQVVVVRDYYELVARQLTELVADGHPDSRVQDRVDNIFRAWAAGPWEPIPR